MKKLVILFLSVALFLSCSAAAADPLTSYADVQNLLLDAAYKIKPTDAILSGTVADVLHSYTFRNLFYLFVMVDPDDVSMWSTENDNYFVVQVYTDKDPFPFCQGDAVTVEGQVISIYSSPVCPYIKPDKINGSDDF